MDQHSKRAITQADHLLRSVQVLEMPRTRMCEVAIPNCVDRNRRANILRLVAGKESLPAGRMRRYRSWRTPIVSSTRELGVASNEGRVAPAACVVHNRSEPNATIQHNPYPYRPAEY
jgi:hypothetical protein